MGVGDQLQVLVYSWDDIPAMGRHSGGHHTPKAPSMCYSMANSNAVVTNSIACQLKALASSTQAADSAGIRPHCSCSTKY